MSTAEHREQYEPRGSRTDLGAPGVQLPRATRQVYLKIDGRLVYLWRAVDAEGEALEFWSRP
jgi:DDE domain